MCLPSRRIQAQNCRNQICTLFLIVHENFFSSCYRVFTRFWLVCMTISSCIRWIKAKIRIVWKRARRQSHCEYRPWRSVAAFHGKSFIISQNDVIFWLIKKMRLWKIWFIRFFSLTFSGLKIKIEPSNRWKKSLRHTGILRRIYRMYYAWGMQPSKHALRAKNKKEKSKRTAERKSLAVRDDAQHQSKTKRNENYYIIIYIPIVVVLYFYSRVFVIL